MTTTMTTISCFLKFSFTRVTTFSQRYSDVPHHLFLLSPVTLSKIE